MAESSAIELNLILLEERYKHIFLRMYRTQYRKELSKNPISDEDLWDKLIADDVSRYVIVLAKENEICGIGEVFYEDTEPFYSVNVYIQPGYAKKSAIERSAIEILRVHTEYKLG